MNIRLPESLESFIAGQVSSGHHESPSAYIEKLVREDEQRQADAALLERVNAGEPLPVDERFDRRLEALLKEAEASGEPVEVTPQEWDNIEREALEKLSKGNRA